MNEAPELIAEIIVALTKQAGKLQHEHLRALLHLYSIENDTYVTGLKLACHSGEVALGSCGTIVWDNNVTPLSPHNRQVIAGFAQMMRYRFQSLCETIGVSLE